MIANPSPKTTQHGQHQQSQQHLYQQQNMYNAQMNNLTENLNKMNINNASIVNQQQQQQQQAQMQQPPPPHLTQAQIPMNNNFPKVFPQVNGIGYNPYKIIGFQNKETNEFARNVLKQESNYNMIPTQHHHQTAFQPPPQISANILPVPSNFHHPPPQQPSPQPQSHHIPPASSPYMWKEGDRCYAKYWEDNRYYPAKITGVSESTYVVVFLEYGNYEEVLKTDIYKGNC